MYLVNKEQWKSGVEILSKLEEHQINFIVLAGFLWLIPSYLIQAYPDDIINIHPALLPKYGGKGMYGMKVHESVKEAAESETGITIHLVNEDYDKGAIIFQKSCPINSETQTAEEISECVHALEYKYFPKVIEEFALKHAMKIRKSPNFRNQ